MSDTLSGGGQQGPCVERHTSYPIALLLILINTAYNFSLSEIFKIG